MGYEQINLELTDTNESKLKRLYGEVGVDANYVFDSKDIPRCTCGSIIKPNVVLYNESLPEDVWNEAIKLIKEADTMIIGGTSLTVFPAAYLIDYFHGSNLVLINKDKTSYDDRCTLVINDKLGNVFSKL